LGGGGDGGKDGSGLGIGKSTGLGEKGGLIGELKRKRSKGRGGTSTTWGETLTPFRYWRNYNVFWS